MKLLRLVTNCSFLRRLFLPALALLLSRGAAQAEGTNYPSVIMADNPVGYYRFEELPGATTAVDSSSNGFNATYNYDSTNVSPQLGLPGIDTNSIGFFGDASSDYGYIDIPFNELLAPTNSAGLGTGFSVECWAQAYSANNGGAYLSIVGVFGPYSSAPYGNASGWLLGQTPGPGSTWLFNMKNAGFLNVGAVVPLQWTHLVGTWDGTNQVFYINGQMVFSAPEAGYLADNGADGMVGAVPNAGLVPSGPYGTWNGGVDELAFYTNALTPLQISNHYAVGTNSFRVVSTAPGILTQPDTQTNYSGTDVTFSVVADGTGPLYYQWIRAGTGPIPGATNADYSFISQYPADNAASFSVRITNSVGSSNSVVVALTVETNIVIAGPPFSITRNVGSHAAFRVAASGALPIGYQWLVSSNGTSFTTLTNQVADTLWFTNVQMALSGNEYWVVVTNPFTSYSNFATLTVQPRTENVTLTGYSAIVAADNPVAYWQLNEATNATTAVDAVGSFDGAYDNTLGAIDFGIPSGVPNDTNTMVDLRDPQTTTISQGGVVNIPYALELNPYGPFSVEAWVRPDATNSVFRVPYSSMYSPNSDNNIWGWNMYQYAGAGYWTLNLFSGISGSIFYTDGQYTPLTPGTWYYLVFTDDGTSIQLYVDGLPASYSVPVATSYAPQGVNGDPSLNAADEILGQRSDGAFFGANAGEGDIAFYNYALTPAQIQAHYVNKTILNYSDVNGQVTLTWSAGILVGSTNLAGPYTPVTGAVSPYLVPMTYNQFFYYLGAPK
jgi:hypothetical protein